MKLGVFFFTLYAAALMEETMMPKAQLAVLGERQQTLQTCPWHLRRMKFKQLASKEESQDGIPQCKLEVV